MDASDSEEAHEGQVQSDQTSSPQADTAHQTASRKAQEQAAEAAEGLRDQIAALRRQVRDAHDTLRDHKRRQESRTFKS